MGRPSRPVGTVTRGTTNPNRLRRIDRWLAGPAAWRLRRAAGPPLVIDLGYGASPVTTVELFERLRKVRRDVEVVGIEIDPARVEAAQPLSRPGLSFAHGGFELGALDAPARAGQGPVIVRAANVLRQYAEHDVTQSWRTLTERLARDGIVVDGTCDELGRISTWVTLTVSGPATLTMSLRLAGLDDPAILAERLPKALIHHNVPGEPVHALMAALSRAWRHQAPLSVHGARQRFVAAVREMRAGGIPVLDEPSRWRLGELTVPWGCVAPAASKAVAGPRTPAPAPKGQRV